MYSTWLSVTFWPETNNFTGATSTSAMIFVFLMLEPKERSQKGLIKLVHPPVSFMRICSINVYIYLGRSRKKKKSGSGLILCGPQTIEQGFIGAPTPQTLYNFCNCTFEGLQIYGSSTLTAKYLHWAMKI